MGPPLNQNESLSNSLKVGLGEQNGSSQKSSEVSKFRQAAPQVLAVNAKNLLLLTYGCTLGFSTILIPELQKPNPEIEVTIEELTWISSMNLILVPVGCLGSGFLSQYFGRKKTMMLSNIPFIAAWILYYYAYNSTMLFCALAMTGLTGGMLEAPVLTYVAEITQPHLRGMLSATSTTAVIIGIFVQMLAGKLTNWRIVALLNITFPGLCLFLLFMVPESPHWLIGKGRLEDANKSLRWLRGWVPAAQVQDEYNRLCKAIQNSVGSVESRGAETIAGEKSWRHYTKRTFWMPFGLVAFIFTVANFGGMSSLQTYSVYIFTELRAPIDKYTATVLLGAAELIGTLSCVILIHFTGKRKLGLVSTLSTSLCFAVVALYGQLIDWGYVTEPEKYNWIPTYTLIGCAYLNHLGIRLLPWVLIGEVFSPKVRSGGAGAASSYGYICTFLVNKVFLYMVNGITLAGTFWFYAAVGLVGSLVIYFILPETEGRTLLEIEEHYAGIQDLKKRPQKEDIPFKEKWAAANPTPVVDDLESKL